jgi:hypothetical protein
MELRFIIIFLAGAMGALLANRGISVFNDAVRPIYPEYREGRMTRFAFASTTFGLNFGLVIGFGIPFSIMSPIILVHSLWLGTDIIGTVCPGKPMDHWYKDRQSLLGASLSSLLGGLYGIALLVGLQAVVNASKRLPINIFDSWQSLSDPVLYAFAAFPCIVVAMDYGWKKGLLSLGVVVLLRQLVAAVPNATVANMADGLALLVGLIFVVVFAFRDKSSSTGDLSSIFGDRVKNIKKNIPWIAAMGAIYAIACNIHLLMEGPQSLVAVKSGKEASAIAITAARALSFIPLKGLTSLASGTFATDGFGFTATAGLLAPNPVLAAIFGAIVMSLEALSLVAVAKLFDHFPGVKKSSDSMRVAMTKVLEVAILVGSMIAANGMAPNGLGFLLVAGLFVMNEYFKRPITRMAVGPIATIIVGLLVNVLAVMGLYHVAS